MSFKRPGAVLALLAFALAAGAQFTLSTLDARPRGRLLYLVAIAVTLVAARWLHVGRAADEPSDSVPGRVAGARSWKMATLALALAIGAAIGVYRAGPEPWPLLLWVCAVVTFLISSGMPGWSLPTRARRRVVVLGGLFALAALALRVPMLETLPPDLHIDEAKMALESRKVLSGEMTPLLALGWDLYPSLGFAIHTASMALVGDTLAGFRTASVVGGLLSITLTVLLARLLFGSSVGLIAGALITVSHWHIHLSRLGLHYMDGLVTSLASVYFLTLGVTRGSQRAFPVAGVALGMCFYVYYSTRFAMVLAAAILLIGALHFRRPMAWWLRSIGWIALGGLITLAPLLVVYAQDPDAALARSERVSIFSPRNFEFVETTQQINGVPAVLRFQAQRTLEMFNIGWDSSSQYGSRDPLLDAITGVLFVVGVIVAVSQIRSFAGQLLLGWLALALIVVTLTNGVPFSPRAIIALPAVIMLAGIGMTALRAALSGALPRAPSIALNATMVSLVLVIAAFNVWGYFGRYIVQSRPSGTATTAGRILASGQDLGTAILVGGEDLEHTVDIVRFLAPRALYQQRFAEPYVFEFQSGPSTILVDPRTPRFMEVVETARGSLQNGELVEHRNPQGRLVLAEIRSR
jgi:4-amino-4-deoxy-L-arabinose transferase-like glycosyltransferase